MNLLCNQSNVYDNVMVCRELAQRKRYGDDLAENTVNLKFTGTTPTDTVYYNSTGTTPTDKAEAGAIIDGSRILMVSNNFDDLVAGPHSDDSVEADAIAIIDHANGDDMDVTGKAGATLYAAATDITTQKPAWIRGSIPNYRAESQYILSGVFGNYNNNLEKPLDTLLRVPARTVAYQNVDNAYNQNAQTPDCTGMISKGVHGISKENPICTEMVSYKKLIEKVEEEQEESDEQQAESETTSQERRRGLRRVRSVCTKQRPLVRIPVRRVCM
jgi:hypothetical protein